MLTGDLLSEFDRGDGTCKYYDDDTKLCTIYEDRPLICRIDDMFDEIPEVKEQFGTKLNYYQINHKICEKLKKMDKQLNNNNDD